MAPAYHWPASMFATLAAAAGPQDRLKVVFGGQVARRQIDLPIDLTCDHLQHHAFGRRPSAFAVLQRRIAAVLRVLRRLGGESSEQQQKR